MSSKGGPYGPNGGLLIGRERMASDWSRGCHSNRNRGSGGSRAQATGSHVTGTGKHVTGSAIAGTGSDVMATGSGVGNRELAGKKDRGLRGPEVT